MTATPCSRILVKGRAQSRPEGSAELISEVCFHTEIDTLDQGISCFIDPIELKTFWGGHSMKKDEFKGDFVPSNRVVWYRFAKIFSF